MYHPNRFVRETAHFTLKSLCGALPPEELAAVGEGLAVRIADGLSDNWSQVGGSLRMGGGGMRWGCFSVPARVSGTCMHAWKKEGVFPQPKPTNQPTTRSTNPQVRYAACVAARAFTAGIPPESASRFYPALLPAMCLNRYYVAEGVRLYAQESWRRAVGERGRGLVAAHIDDVVRGAGRGRGAGACVGSPADAHTTCFTNHQPPTARTRNSTLNLYAVTPTEPNPNPLLQVAYYIAQSKANNHAVREAACACIAELMEKVDKAAAARHVPALLRALVTCFKDMSWPVRDAACVACGRWAVVFLNGLIIDPGQT